MATTIKADGDRWKVRLGQERPSPGVRLVLFFCQTTDQRPYRVVEVPEDRIDSPEDLARLPKADLMELYRESTSLDVPKLRSDEIQDVRRGRTRPRGPRSSL